MIKLAANQYLKSIGDKHFIPTPDYLEWADVNCLDIAIKRKPKWIWQETKHFYDHMSINDLIDSPLPDDISVYLKPPEPINSTFSWSSKHNISGKIGGGIASLVALDLNADDVVKVSIHMAGMVKQSIDHHAVVKVLKTKKINFNGDYIRHIANNKHNVICLVTQYIYLTKQAEMKVSIDMSVGEKASETGTSQVSVDNEAKVDYEKNKSIIFDVGTRFAFDFLELLIHPDGSFVIMDRSGESWKRKMIPNLPEIGQELPNYCVHVTKDFDVPDEVNTDNLPSSSDDCSIDKCLQLLAHEDIRTIIRDLLTIAIENKTLLKQLDSFMIACQGAITVDLTIFKENRNNHLIKLLKSVGIETDVNSNDIIQSNTLNQDIIQKILFKIEAIFHLELPYLQNLLSIIDEGSSEHMALLFTYLHDLKKDNLANNTENRDKLFQEWKYKLLLLSIGVTETSTKMNKYFEPVLILLHAS